MNTTTDALPLPSDSVPGNPQSAIGNLQSNIARLPKVTRDMLNVMLDDSLPYRVILDELGEAAEGLTASSLAQWVKAGYANYLKERQTIQDVKTESEFAADLIRELGNVDPSVITRACLVVANLQLFSDIREYGDQALEDMLRANPSSYLNLLNTLCNLVQPMIDLENHHIALEKAGPKPPAVPGKLGEMIGPKK